MEQFLLDFVTQYGPLALGWPFCLYFIRQNKSIQDKLMDIAISNIAVNTEVKNAVSLLSDFIKTLIANDNR